MINLLDTTDAKVWAEEFCRLYNAQPNFTIDEGLMIAWFANAIERGRIEGKKEGSRLEYAPNIATPNNACCETILNTGSVTAIAINDWNKKIIDNILNYYKIMSPGVSITEND